VRLKDVAGYFYEVLATATDDRAADQWLDWMRTKHLADVIAAGAHSGRVIRLDDSSLIIAAQYEFESREAFERYVRDHAPRLRAEGIERFGDRLSYSRRTGQIVDEASIQGAG
jgi:hypothetical protein